MSYQDLLSKVKALVEEHNQNAGEKARVKWEDFQDNLQAAGGTNEKALAACKFEDLEGFGLPRLIARQAAEIFRETNNDSSKTPSKRRITENLARHMTAREAFEYYDPRDIDTPLGKRLQELSRGLRCVVFNSDGSVNSEVSAKLVEEIRDGYPERESYSIDGMPVQIYRIGEKAFDFKDENPIYKGRMLRPDGTCDQLNRSWAGVSMKAKQMVYLAVNVTGEIVINGINDAQNVLDMCLTDDASVKLCQRYPKTALKYSELDVEGLLPKLRIKSTCVVNGKPNDPFHGGHKRT